MRLPDKITAYLADHPGSNSFAIAAGTGASRGRVVRALGKLEQAGIVTSELSTARGAVGLRVYRLA